MLKPKRLALAVFLASNSPFSSLYAADTACEVTLSNGGVADIRSFPVTSGDTVLNGRTDGNPAPCAILGLGSAKVSYPNGLTINTNGTGIIFKLIESSISNGLTVDDAGIGSGLVVFQAEKPTKIEGPVTLSNSAKLRLVTHNNESSVTRLRLSNAYFNINSGSELQVEYKLGDATGGDFVVGSLSGSGSMRLSNVGSSSRGGNILIQNGDGQDYSYSGDITYESQKAPSISKSGTGAFTFTGDIINASGVLAGFNDGFDNIEVNGGSLVLTSDAFISGSNVQINSGNLILDQNFSGELTGAKFFGTGALVKRGTGAVTLRATSGNYIGDVIIEEGTLGLSSDANLSNANLIHIQSGATLDITNVFNETNLSRLKGSGTLALGDKTARGIITLSPGNSIGVFNVTGTGNLDLNTSKINIEMDPTLGPGDSPGVTHDQLAVSGSVSANTRTEFNLIDVQNGSSPSAFLNGREFTIATAGSGLSAVSPLSIVEDSSFHAFVGADPNTAIITDTEVKVQFGIKTVQQVVNNIATTTVVQPNGSTTTGSKTNKTNAAKQIIKQSTGLTGNQAPTQAQLTSPVLLALTNQKLASAANNNNPEAYSSNLSVNLEYADFVGNLAMDRAAGRGVALREFDKGYVEQNDLWANIEFADGDVDGEQGQTGDFGYKLFSVLVGKDFNYEPDVKLGYFIGAGSSKLDEHDHIDQDIEGDLFQAGIYSTHERSNGYVLSTLLMGLYGQYDSERRNLNTDGSSGPTSESDYNTFGITTGFKFARDVSIENTSWRVTPSSGIAFTYLKQESINESNGGAAHDYEISSTSADSLVFNVGIDANYAVSSVDQSLLLDLRARYEYDVLADRDSTHDIEAGLIGQSKDTFVGQNRGPHGLILGAGMLSELTPRLSAGLGFEYAMRSDGSDSSIGLDINYQL